MSEPRKYRVFPQPMIVTDEYGECWNGDKTIQYDHVDVIELSAYDQLQAECERKDKVIAELRETLKHDVDKIDAAYAEENAQLKAQRESLIAMNNEIKTGAICNACYDYIDIEERDLVLKTKDAQLAKYKAALEFVVERLNKSKAYFGSVEHSALEVARAALAEGEPTPDKKD
jgi:hypothetical protein